MTLPTTTSRAGYTGDGVTTLFAVPFRFWTNGDLKVVLRDAPSGAEFIQTLGLDYVVAGAGSPLGGSITFAAAPPATKLVHIVREPAPTQELDLQANGAFAAETVETALDKIAALAQMLLEQLSRTLRLPVTTPQGNLLLPEPNAAVANQVLAINGSGTAYALAALANLATTPVSSFIAGLLDDADAATARATLGVVEGTQSRMVDAQGGATYAFVTGDRGRIKRRTHSANMADTLPQAGGANFPNGWFAILRNDTASFTDTLTPAGCTINGAASLIVHPGQEVEIRSDNSNYIATAQPLLTGLRWEPLPANSFIPRTTNGPAGPTKLEAATNRNNREVLDFDATTTEYADKEFALPPSYDGGALKAMFEWEVAAGTAAQTLTWGIQARFFGDGDDIDQALGTAGEIADSVIGTGKMHVTAEVSFTPAGTWAAGKKLFLRVYRKGSTGTHDADARLREVRVGLVLAKANDQ